MPDGSSPRGRSRGRLVVVSNRVPKGDVPAGGLIYALDEALRGTGGSWIGADEPGGDTSGGLRDLGPDPTGAYQRFAFPLSHAEQEGYYLGYSNSVLWPLFHHRPDLVAVSEGDFDHYVAVNRRVARALRDRLEPDDMIWIHDYHFLMLAHELRQMGVENRIGLFLHIPFPGPTDAMALPQVAMLPAWLAAHDLLGLQTERDVIAALELLRHDPHTELLNNGMLSRQGRTFSVRRFPIGIDAEGFARTAEAGVLPRLTLPTRDSPLLLGVDRLDYSKGLVKRFDAFGTYLAEHRDPDVKPTYLQIAPVSRGDVVAYQDIREDLERTAGSINGAHSTLDWTPIRYVRSHVDRDRLAALYRRADVALVTPLADGMNLVAKEYVAAQDPDDPGVLILSHFAGAAEQMTEALLVNPYDEAGFAAAIDRALRMPAAERRARHAALREGVFRDDVGHWAETFLDRLAEAPASLPLRMRAG
ncbi:trehalose-6-phosphate synthase [Jannaschia sp. Os4]|uniref:alpha,alpha-trehalose-phosphate synthase (UDP-forming) n=1 Tax=Jannaschia sp. Os4 TaxID=2807617 RepID=UPI00193A5530|nr:trehalose-6-phosphate synthase [Jannaschia sp. Os4]MBM2576019.1 trehalose-6-phosphate synthase [Jannaschia sp. Os4]